MFDILIFFAVIYFVGSTLMKRVVTAQKRAGAPQRSGRPNPSGAPPWMRAGTSPQTPIRGSARPASATETQPAPNPNRSTFEKIYEAIRDPAYPSVQEGESLSPSLDPAPEKGSMAMEQSSGSLGSYETTEGISESHLNPIYESSNEGSAQPVTIPGLNIALNADTLVQGVIFSEILNRKGRGMRR